MPDITPLAQPPEDPQPLAAAFLERHRATLQRLVPDFDYQDMAIDRDKGYDLEIDLDNFPLDQKSTRLARFEAFVAAIEGLANAEQPDRVALRDGFDLLGQCLSSMQASVARQTGFAEHFQNDPDVSASRAKKEMDKLKRREDTKNDLIGLQADLIPLLKAVGIDTRKRHR